MEKIVLKATRRTVTGKQVKALRRQGFLPAVLYGHHFESTPVTLDLHDASLKLAAIKGSTIVNIDLEGTVHAALVREKQRNYINNILKHVDFQVVSLTEKISTSVSLEFVGNAPALKLYEALVLTNLEELEVEALPQDLPEKIVIDLSKLNHLNDHIMVKDVVVPAGVEIINDADDIIVIIKAIAEEKAAEESTSAEPELVERTKKSAEIED